MVSTIPNPDINSILVIMTQLLTDYSELARSWFNMFYNPTPMDVQVKFYDEQGVLQTYTLPNRAKDFNYIKNGNGSPEGVLVGVVGTIYQDLTNGTLYIKAIGADKTGWVVLATQEDLNNFIVRGIGNPEGFVTRDIGTFFVDTLTGLAFIKTTTTGNTGWVELITEARVRQIVLDIISDNYYNKSETNTLLNNKADTSAVVLKANQGTWADETQQIVIDNSGKLWAEKVQGLPIGAIHSGFYSKDYTPEGMLPCDGSELARAQFSEFYDNYLIASPTKVLTCTYEEYTTEINTYGRCPKFGLDSVNEKFRIPLINDGTFIQQALSDSEIGKDYSAGLPNITGSSGISSPAQITSQGESQNGAVHMTWTGTTANSAGTGQSQINWQFDASKSNSIYGNSTTVQPQSTALRHFVVIANGTINQAMMDWSAWATSLASKANNDLSNVTSVVQDFKTISVNWGMPDYGTSFSRNVQTLYTAETDGYAYSFSQTGGAAVGLCVEVNNRIASSGFTSTSWFIALLVPVARGDTYIFRPSGLAPACLFFPCKASPRNGPNTDLP